MAGSDPRVLLAETSGVNKLMDNALSPTIRVMTWNIHGGIGPDRSRDLRRVVDLVQSHQPQIIALQEIDSRRGTSSTPDAFDFLNKELGGNSHATRLIRAPDGDYGHAVISCWPMAAARYHDISYKRREPRAAIETVVDTPHGSLHVVAAHLGLSFRERRQQAEKLVQIVRKSDKCSVLMGDLNDWIAGGAVRRILDRQFPGHSHMKTFPACRPIFPLDRIYCRPKSILQRSQTDHTARLASDHLPVIADLILGNCP
ncbi:endonuclease/exonuclease/phosphatase family protein [Sulfitobacter sp. PS-8MA]|uniref:endonuclease/exonuclease/phosphatase family protein n=1 Tax=Sulfitobacter sp. PS-8MA TaxID=3237707 RepID=UPI0034C5D22B